MELRHLRYFLAVAEELNFSRAARRMNMSQPPLTQQIKDLEEELGVALFDRSAYRIRLTEAGQAFAREASRILGEVRDAVLVARRAAGRATDGQVRVGFTESASFNPIVTSVFRDFRAAWPHVEVTLEEHPSTDLALALREERIDVAFLRPPLRSEEGLTLHLLEEEQMVAAIPNTHRLAKRRSLQLSELRDETFILYPRVVRPGLADAVVSACKRAGFTPRVSQYAPQLSSTINLIAASMGISIVPQSMQRLQPKAVAFVPLKGAPLRAALALAHRSKEAAKTVLNFIEIARSRVVQTNPA